MPLPEPSYQNSAGRLLAILTTISASPSGQSYIELVPALFSGKGKTTGLKKQLTEIEKRQACIVGLREIHKLYLEFQQDMLDAEISEQQRKVLLTGLESIQHSIYPVALNTGYRPLTEAEKSLLEVAATVIPNEPNLPENDIERIQESISSLRFLVDEADISPSIKKVLFDLIRVSENAIARYNIHGSRGLRRAFKEMLAEVMELHSSTVGEGDREALRKTGAWAAIVKNLKIFDEISSRLVKYKPLLETFSKLLLGGSASGN